MEANGDVRADYTPVNPVVGMLSEYVLRCDNLPLEEQIRLCQKRIKGQRSRIRDLRMKDRAGSELKNALLIVEEEKQRIIQLFKKIWLTWKRLRLNCYMVA